MLQAAAKSRHHASFPVGGAARVSIQQCMSPVAAALWRYKCNTQRQPFLFQCFTIPNSNLFRGSALAHWDSLGGHSTPDHCRDLAETPRPLLPTPSQGSLTAVREEPGKWWCRSANVSAGLAAQLEKDRQRAEKLKEKNKRAQRKFRQRQKVSPTSLPLQPALQCSGLGHPRVKGRSQKGRQGAGQVTSQKPGRRRALSNKLLTL